MSIIDATELNVFEFWKLLHDAVVWNCSNTESGREYLENAYIYNQTEPDRDKLRSQISKRR